MIRNQAGLLYKGITTNLEKRLIYHNTGLSRWTKHKGPFELIHVETYNSKTEALIREKFLKSGKGREYLKTLLKAEDNSGD